MVIPDYIPPDKEHLYPLVHERIAGKPAYEADYLPDDVAPEPEPPRAPSLSPVPDNVTAPLLPKDFYPGEVNSETVPPSAGGGPGGDACQEPETEPAEGRKKGGRPKKS